MLRRLSYRYVLAHRSRSRFTIATIMLSAILMIIVYTLYASVTKTHREAIVMADGRYDLSIAGLRDDELAKLERLPFITGTVTRTKLGEVFMESEHMPNGLKQEAEPSVIRRTIPLISVEGDYKSFASVSRLEGELPRRHGEIALSAYALEQLGAAAAIGDTIRLRYDDGSTDSVREASFTLSGILHFRTLQEQDKRLEAIVKSPQTDGQAASYLQEHRTVYMNLYRKHDLQAAANSLAASLSIPSERIEYSAAAITRSNVDDFLPYAVVFLVIVVFSMSIIIGIFTLSLKDRVRDLGLLQAIGTTKRQLRRMLLHEAIYYLLWGLPAGVIIGLAGGYLIIRNITLSGELLFAVSPQALLIISALVSGSVLVSIYLAYFSIRGVSVVEALKSNQGQGKIRKQARRRLKKSPLYLYLAADISSNRIRFLFQTLVLALACTIFVFLVLFFNSLNHEKLVEQMMPSDMTLSYNYKNNPETAGVVIIRDEDRDNGQINGMPADVVAALKASPELEVTAFKFAPYAHLYLKDQYKTNLHAYGYDEEAAEEVRGHVIEGEFHAGRLDAGDEVLLYRTLPGDPLSVGDEVLIELQRGDETISRTVTIGGILDELPVSNSYRSAISIVMPNEVFSSLFGIADYHRADIIVKSQEESWELRMREWADRYNLVMKTKGDVRQSVLQELGSIMFLGYAFGALVTFIVLVSYINYLMTSVQVRRREFGLLQCIGMTPSMIGKLIIAQACLSILIGAAAGTGAGAGLGYWLVNYIGRDNSHIAFQFTPLSLLVLPAMLLVAVLLGIVLVRRMSSETPLSLILGKDRLGRQS
ncbi:ABC transporter permease [Paenibacillus sp. J5C_2022]|uniref:ABC transporter permease n=1 Tax=Paenibacillus sp. J5C2022 TaxID=2977129 RepID=UPI0021CEE945|nr:ABC transporter permease [Paenibacillus sp. J5C2022]MCU6707880.1 ABC transporter permease [Paenibacillus sp. J5C2022]